MGIITNTTKERLEELKQQQETISEKILIEKSKQKMTLTKSDIYARFPPKRQPGEVWAQIKFVIK